MANGVELAMDILIALGIGVFILNLILALTYEGQAQATNQIVTQFGSNSGVAQNYSRVSGNVTSSYGNNLPLAIFALVFIAIIVAILVALRGRVKTGGGDGGYLK